MSILRTLNIGASGLRSNSEALGVTGDNIANVNTVGFKRSRAVFQDVLGRSIATTLEPVKTAGAGSRMAHVEQMWSQGSLVSTESPTDLAIQGDGFFVVAGNLGGAESRFYTRAGQFHLDSEGRIVNSDDFRLQGYTADGQGVMGATVGDLVVSQGTIPARMTSEVRLAANLDSNSQVPALVPFDINNPNGSSNFSNQATVYDSLGNAHELTLYYNKTASNSWEWHAVIAGEQVSNGQAGLPFEGASGTLTFDTSGRLDTETVSTSSWDFVDAAPAQQIEFDFGTSLTTDGGDGLDGTTQFAAPSATTALQQDGYASGSVAGISIEKDGTVIGVFSNGQQRSIGQVVTADFANVTGLERTGQGMWIETLASGQALIGGADAGGRGSIVAGTLEQANVDLGTEFVNMIAYQRGFQANSRVITTADEMYGELVNLKR
jgi:flagellar hook protein FlgE